jgi:hypothetical protein
MPCSVCPFGAVQACTAFSDAVCLATAWNASTSGYSPSGLLAARVQASEGVTLVADLFALNSALAAAGYPVVLQRAVPAGPAYAFMPDGLADSRPGQGGVRYSTGSGLSNASFSPTRVAAVAGLDIGIVQARWTLFGVPSALLEPVVFSSGAKDSASVSKLHHLSFAAATLSVVVPPGQLFPGYVYAVNCEIDLAVKLALDYSNLQAGVLPAAALAAAAPANYKAINDLATARMMGSAAAYNVSSPPDVVLVSARQMRNAFLYVHAPVAIASVAVAPAKSPPLWDLVATSAGAGDAAMWAPATSAPPLTAALAWALATLPLGPPAILAILGATTQQMTAANAATALGSATSAASFVPGSDSVAAEALFAAALTGAPPFAGSQSAVAPGFVSTLGVNVTAVNSTSLTAAVATTVTLSPNAAAAALASGPFAALAPTAASAAAAQLQANKLVQALLFFPGVPPHAAPSVAFSFFADTTGAATLPSGAVPAASNAADPAAAALQQLALANASGAFILGGWVALLPEANGRFALPAGSAAAGFQVRIAALACDAEGACAAAVSSSSALVCPSGAFAEVGRGSCLLCPGGTASANTSVAATATRPQPCASCLAGFFSAPGASACSPCAAGTLSVAGATACSPCPAGSWCSGLTVTPCAAGLDSPAGSTSAANCTVCAQSFFCPGGGAVQCAVGTVSPVGSVSAANCTALSAASVGAAISSLGNVSTPAAALGALATAGSIASFLDLNSTASASSNSSDANSTAAALAAATAARGAVIAQIGALVNVLAGGGAGGGGAAALVAAANVTNSTSLNSTAFQALLADTSIPLSPNATSAVAEALSALTSSPTQLSAEAASDALDALSSISLLSLPVNVLSGAVDLAGSAAAAPANSSSAGGGNATAPPPVPPLPAATASLFLTTIGNVAAAVSQSSNATANAAVQVKVAAALGAVSAAVLRAAVAGDPPTSVRAGAASAFNASSGAGFCGDALSLTVARLSSNGSLALGLSEPIAPCGGAASASGAATSPAPALDASAAFLATAARGASALGIAAGSVDVSFVQNGRSPVPESAGFAALGALGPPAPLDTRVVSVVLQSRAGNKIAVVNSSTPLAITLPLASGSNASSAALALQAAYTRRFVSVACAASARPSRVLVDCGAPVGARNVSCEASPTAYNGTYRCPEVQTKAQCVFWDTGAGAWSSQGCVTLPSSSTGAITCACNHTTEFAARFSALAAQQQEIFGRGGDLLVNSADNFRQYPHVAAILGIILGLTLLALVAGFALDREGSGRFYESLQADREVQFLARIENLKGGVFVLDRVLDHRVDALQEKIAQARLESQARAIAEAEGMMFLQRGVELPSDVSGAVSLRHVATDLNARRRGVFTSSVLKVLGRGGRGLRPATGSSASTEDGALNFAHANVLFDKKRAVAAAGAMPASVGVGSAKDALAGPAAVAHPAPEGAAARALSILSGDGFALAIYARLTRSFESLSVSGGKNSRLEALWHSGAAGNSSDIAAAFGLSRRTAGATVAEGEAEGAAAAAAPLSPSSRAIATLLHDEDGVDSLAAQRAKRLEAEAEEAAAAAAAASKEHESAAHVLDSVGGWSCLRAWRLRSFLLRTWLLGVLYQHPVLGLFSKFDPRISRTLRVLVLASSLIADLWTTTFLYAFVVGGDSSKPLPDLTIPETIVVAVLSSLLQVPIGALIGILATRAGESECECWPRSSARSPRFAAPRPDTALRPTSSSRFPSSFSCVSLPLHRRGAAPPQGHGEEALEAVQEGARGGACRHRGRARAHRAPRRVGGCAQEGGGAARGLCPRLDRRA